MRTANLLAVGITLSLLGASPAAADADPAVPEAPVDEAGAEPQAAPELLPLERSPAETPELGPVGHDEQGRRGRVHIVVSGDTLWDVSEAYLGSAWAWPSIWDDNRQIENPHRIYPGDRIWITRDEMRRITAEEAAALLAAAPSPAAPAAPAPSEAVPAPEAAMALADPRPFLRVSNLEGSGLVSEALVQSAASVVDAVPDRVMLSQGDEVYIGLGDGEVSPGDQFTIFRTNEKVLDPETGRTLGYHVDTLGWVEVMEPDAETSLARIRESNSAIERGDRILPREKVDPDIEIQGSPGGVEGQISFFAKSRTVMPSIDFVYLNRGELDGLEVGSPLEVFRPSYRAREKARNERVRVPARVVAQMIVVRAEPESAVAFVAHTATELRVGDHFRAPEM